MWLSCVKGEKTLWLLVLTSVLQSQPQISFYVSCRLCSLWCTIVWSSEIWAAYLCFVVSPALVLTARNGQMRQTSSFLERLKLWKPAVLLSSSTVTAELLGKATFPQDLSDCQALWRYAESTTAILFVQQARCDSLPPACFMPSLLDLQDHPKQAAAETCSFFCRFCEDRANLTPYIRKKRLSGCWRGVWYMG